MSKKRVTPELRKLIRNFIIELVVYGVLVVGYFLVVLRLLTGTLTTLFIEKPVFYAVIALLLIVLQGVLLDWVTSFLLDQIKLERLE
ncbi:MAG TPA: hypothetical protein VI451_10605 [Anaerolineales bacterium]|jgi:hypothetical protein|nr:hypothetical protein [Anaerolineales bacterium]